MRFTLFASLALAATPIAAQDAAPPAAAAAPPASPHLRSLAAGYVALTTCSGYFTARGNRGIWHIERNELQGIYPDLDPLVASLEPELGGSQIAVAWDEAMPPRVAVARRDRGCTLLPPGMTISDPGSPGFTVVDHFAQDWPYGDRGAPIPIALAARATEPVATAFDGGYGSGTNTTAVVVVAEGRIVAERYGRGFGKHIPQRTWSVAKSIAATIIGAAVHRGEVDVAAPAAIANWQDDLDPRRAITLDHLLHMASGLTSDSAGNRTDAIYFGGTTVDEQAPSWPLIAVPGTTFRYANNDTLLATLAIAPTFAAHPPRAFFDSIAMRSTVAETDWRGNYILSSQVWTTARDLARFGMLYVNDGVWNDTRILPENWRSYVSRPSGPQPPGDFGYGASFWLINRSTGVPADTIAAFGNRGQYVVIVPSRNIVIVRRGEDPSGARFDIAAFTRDVLAALE